jgi:hypothetical protein
MRYLVRCLCAALLIAGGCGRGAPVLAPVSGRAFYRGQPLRGGTVVFSPDPERGGRGPLACAEIGPDGTYVLATGLHRGAVCGWHRVTIAAPCPADPTALRLPSRFSDPELSGVCVEVKAGQDNALDLRLE